MNAIVASEALEPVVADELVPANGTPVQTDADVAEGPAK